METVIVICLLIVIVLLLQDKIVINKSAGEKSLQENSDPDHPDIMGQPKPVRSPSVPNNARKAQIEKREEEAFNFDIEFEEVVNIQVPLEELDETFGTIPDFEEEEEEWHRYRGPNGEDGFATGVTFEELNIAGTLLQLEVLEPTFKEQAIDIVHKIQGTELFSLLENSMENASKKIAELLDKSFTPEVDSGSSIKRNNNLEDFDIGKFI